MLSVADCHGVPRQNSMVKKHLTPSALPLRKRPTNANQDALASVLTSFCKMRGMVITNGRIWVIN